VNITVTMFPESSIAAVELDTTETPLTTPSVTVIIYFYIYHKTSNRIPRLLLKQVTSAPACIETQLVLKYCQLATPG